MCAFVTQEAATEEALSARTQMQVQLVNLVVQFSGTLHNCSAVSVMALLSACPEWITFSYLHSEGGLFFRHSNHFPFRSEPGFSHGLSFLTAGDVKRNAGVPAMKVYRFSFPLDTNNEGLI